MKDSKKKKKRKAKKESKTGGERVKTGVVSERSG